MTQILSDLEQCWGVQKVVNFLKPLECIVNSDPATQGTWNGIVPPNHCMRLPSFVSFLFKPTCSYLTSPYHLSKSRAEFSEIELVENGPDRMNNRTHGHDLPAPPPHHPIQPDCSQQLCPQLLPLVSMDLLFQELLPLRKWELWQHTNSCEPHSFLRCGWIPWFLTAHQLKSSQSFLQSVVKVTLQTDTKSYCFLTSKFQWLLSHIK